MNYLEVAGLIVVLVLTEIILEVLQKFLNMVTTQSRTTTT